LQIELARGQNLKTSSAPRNFAGLHEQDSHLI
jgi:hypothetical protein